MMKELQPTLATQIIPRKRTKYHFLLIALISSFFPIPVPLEFPALITILIPFPLNSFLWSLAANLMAEMFLFNTADIILGKLGNLVLQEIGLAMSVQTELTKLQNTLSIVKAVLLDAEEKQTNNRALREWLAKLKDVFVSADDILDEFQTEVLYYQVGSNSFRGKVRNYLPSPRSLNFRFSMGHKLKDIGENLRQIVSLREQFNLTNRTVDRRIPQREMTHSFIRSTDVIGRNKDKDKIVKMLVSLKDSDNLPTIPILGMGGLGKTTLAKLVYNDPEMDDSFELKMWVCVPEAFDTRILMKRIIASATNTTVSDDQDVDQLQNQLRRCLSGKKFLLVLDDAWEIERPKWEELRSLLMDGGRGNGSKVIVTTRLRSVVDVIDSNKYTYNLKGLGQEDCLSLFLKWAFPAGEERKHPKLVKIAREIVKKCEGVPLAARTLGSLLFKKTDEKEWLLVKNSEIWELRHQARDGILPELRLSYNQLPSYLKQCFAYCSIFPKSHYIDKDKLTQLWIAQGFVQASNPNEDLEDVAHQYFNELCSTSFFQEVEQNGPLSVTFRMHDLVHDLAQSVARTECLRKRSHSEDISGMFRHVSLWGCDNLLGEDVPKSLLKLQKLRTIFFPHNGKPSVHDRFVDVCFSTFLCLRVIDLADSSFEVLPSSISNLKHMRYLDLSRNYIIKKLPTSICDLLNLQTLRLSDCKELRELPRAIWKLVSLRHLYITTKQKRLSGRGIGSLISLRTLSISGCVNLVSLPEEIENLTSLQTLTIDRCPKLAYLPSSVATLSMLQNLMINDCEELTLFEVTDIPQLKIRTLVIGDLPKLVAFPNWLFGTIRSIEYLRVAYCPNLVELPEWIKECKSLQKFEVLDCPKLKALPKGFSALSALKVLRVVDCNILIRTLQRGTGANWSMISHIPEIYLNKIKHASTSS